jgi:hypothetical protein
MVYHRDFLDILPTWVYYFDFFEQGALFVSELGINIPVRPRSLLGLNGKYFFHGALPYKKTRSLIAFYYHYSKETFPKFSSFLSEISFLMDQLDWSIQIFDFHSKQKKKLNEIFNNYMGHLHPPNLNRG